MKDIHVWDSVVLSRREFDAGDNRRYAEVEIASPPFASAPGQFMMIRGDKHRVSWAYPYTIQKKMEKSFTVLARSDTDLFTQYTGDKLVFWGPGGMALPQGKPFTVVVQNATYPLLLPVIRDAALCGKVILVDVDNGRSCVLLAGEGMSCEPVDAEAAARQMEEGGAACLVALNLPLLEKVMCSVPDAVKQRTLVFAATKMACGIGACKGCTLHSAEQPAGIHVCCNGPFLPYQSIDFETDRNCFLLL